MVMGGISSSEDDRMIEGMVSNLVEVRKKNGLRDAQKSKLEQLVTSPPNTIEGFNMEGFDTLECASTKLILSFLLKGRSQGEMTKLFLTPPMYQRS